MIAERVGKDPTTRVVRVYTGAIMGAIMGAMAPMFENPETDFVADVDAALDFLAEGLVALGTGARARPVGPARFGDVPGTSRRIRGQPARLRGRARDKSSVPAVAADQDPGRVRFVHRQTRVASRRSGPSPRLAGRRPPSDAARSSVPIHQIHGMMTVMTE